MTQKKKDSGIFTEVKVARPLQPNDQGESAFSTSDRSWKFIRITYPNGVSITVPSDIGTEDLSRFVYLKQ